MATMLNVYDRQTRKKTAVLQNAFDIVETHELNQIYLLSFSLPSTDEKNKFCLPRHFVRWGDDGELYRIKAPKTDENNVGVVTYECEHVITTLCDTVMFGSFDTAQYVSNLTTKSTIEWLLSKQQDWVLDVCDFSRKFEYLWEQENLLNALYSIPKEFASPYMWTFDTTVYPWKISLRLLDTTKNPQYYLRARSNILSSGTAADYANICTRIYPLGYGEGVNQLNIKDVNNGVPYLQSPQNIVNQYGIVEKVLVDRRFENAESLKAYAQSMLDVYQTPTMSRTFDVTDLYPLTGQDWVDAEVGKICKMTQDGSIAYITRTQRQHDKAGDLHIDLSTKPTDIASNVADLADRVRIESVYAQGATQLYQHSKDANATTSKGMIMSLYFPSEMRQINKVLMRLKLGKFRSYSKASSGKSGAINQNTGSNGAINTNTGSNGAINTNTGSNGAINTNTGSNGAINQNTGDGGAINTQSGSGGGTSGQTGVASGGENLSLSASATVSIDDTTDAVWANQSTIATSDTNINDYENYGTQVTTIESGSHSHTLYGHVNSVTPLESVEYKHTHYLDSGDATAGMYETGSHLHTVNDTTGHSHGIARSDLKHYHSGSGTVTVTINAGDNKTQTNFAHSHSFSVGNHSHSITVGAHNHSISVGAHNHSISVNAHSHSISVGSHTHSITVGSHSHDIEAGIFESGNPTSFDIYVGGKKKTTVNSTSYDGDITTWLLNDKNQIPRNSWIDVEIRPNDLAYVQCSVFVQGFVQSRGGGNY
jgi:phage minor structural protein